MHPGGSVHHDALGAVTYLRIARTERPPMATDGAHPHVVALTSPNRAGYNTHGRTPVDAAATTATAT